MTTQQVIDGGVVKTPTRRWVRHQDAWRTPWKGWVRNNDAWVLFFTNSDNTLLYPQSFAVNPAGSGFASAALVWTPPDVQNGIRPARYSIHLLDANGNFLAYQETTGTSVTFSNLASDTTYKFKLWSLNPDETLWVPFTTIPVWYTGVQGGGATPTIPPGFSRPPNPNAPASVFTSRVAWNVGRLNWAYPGGDVNRYQVFVNVNNTVTYLGDTGAGYWDYQNDTWNLAYSLGVRSVSSQGTVSGIVWAATTNGEKPWSFGEAMPVPAGASSEYAFGAAGAPTVDGNFGTGWISGSHPGPGLPNLPWWAGYVPPGTLSGVAIYMYADAPYTCWASFGLVPGGGWNDFGRGVIPGTNIPVIDQRDGIPAGEWTYWWFGGAQGAVLQHCPGGSYGVRLTWTNLGTYKGTPALSGYRANLFEVRWLMASR